MDWKYIRYEGYGFIIWPNSDKIWHAHMAQSYQRKLSYPISAGFIRMTKNGPQCYGRSESLNLDSKAEDTAFLLEQFLYP